MEWGKVVMVNSTQINIIVIDNHYLIYYSSIRAPHNEKIDLVVVVVWMTNL